jgi:hypothetical protein
MTGTTESSSPAVKTNGNGSGTTARSTLIVTNLIKLGGLVLGVKELMTTRDPFVLGVCLMMMSGLHSFEQAIVKAAERFFGN